MTFSGFMFEKHKRNAEFPHEMYDLTFRCSTKDTKKVQENVDDVQEQSDRTKNVLFRAHLVLMIAAHYHLSVICREENFRLKFY